MTRDLLPADYCRAEGDNRDGLAASQEFEQLSMAEIDHLKTSGWTGFHTFVGILYSLGVDHGLLNDFTSLMVTQPHSETQEENKGQHPGKNLYDSEGDFLRTLL